MSKEPEKEGKREREREREKEKEKADNLPPASQTDSGYSSPSFPFHPPAAEPEPEHKHKPPAPKSTSTKPSPPLATPDSAPGTG